MADVASGAAVPPASGMRHAVRAFRSRDYRVFWTGALFSNVGSWFTTLTAPYVLFQLTGSALWVGLASLAALLPGVFLGPHGGSLADHHDRRKTLMFTQGGMAVASVILWATWIGGWANEWVILGCLVVSSVFLGLNMPVWQSFVNDLVPREDLSSAVAMNSLQFNAARALGPALAGAIIALLGPGWAFGLNVLTFVAVLGALLLVRGRGTITAHRTGTSVMRQFAEAVVYVAGQPGIQVAIVVSVLVGLLGNPIFSFTVVFAEDVFHIDAVGLGLLNASLGVGCLLAVPFVSGGIKGLSMGTLVRVATPAFGLSLVGFAVSPNLALAVAVLVFGGACFMTIITSVNTAIQMIVSSSMRGRVISVRIVVFSASMAIGPFVQGWISDQVGPRATVVGAGVLLLASGLVLALWNRGAWLHRLDDPYDAFHDELPEPVA